MNVYFSLCIKYFLNLIKNAMYHSLKEENMTNITKKKSKLNIIYKKVCLFI